MFGKLSTAIDAIIIIIATGLIWLTFHFHSVAVEAKESAEQAKKDQQQAEAITGNVIKATALFNDIAKASNDEQKQNSSQSEERVVYITKTIKDDSCAVQSVPSDAVNKLREHRDKIHSGASNTDTGKPGS